MDTITVRHGKNRDIYDLGNNSLVIVTTDRVSAFDRVLTTEMPGKGKLLQDVSLFWADALDVYYHLIADDPSMMPKQFQTPEFDGRAMLVEKAEVIPFECIVRGFLTGSMWTEYQEKGTVCGEKMPAGMQQNSPLPHPMFTPSTKAATGHDQNVTVEVMAWMIGQELTTELMYKSIDVYQEAYQIAFAKGLIIADTKLEWGQLKHCENEVVLIDEIITPDSSRLWPVESYRVPGHIDSLDKQYIRDYLAVAGKDTAVLPEDVMTTAKNKYVEAYRRLTSDD